MENYEKLTKQLSMLKLGFFCLLFVNILLILFLFRETKMKTFKEITAQRINIVNEHKKPIMVISNNSLIPGPTINGKTYPKEYADGRENLNGIIFFNQYGDEVGGLLYNGFEKNPGYSAFEHFSFDQWKQNQVIALQYLDNGTSKRTGLRIYDRPKDVTLDKMFDRFKKRNEYKKNSVEYDSITKEINTAIASGEKGVERMFMGSLDEIPQIQLKDKNGKVRIKIYIDQAGEAKIDFFDLTGKIIKSFPTQGF